MIIVKKGYEHIVKIAGEQRYSESVIYREACFAVKNYCLDGMLFYNTMTGELLLSDKSDWRANADLKKELVKKWYLVPVDYDENKHCDQVKKVAKLMTSKTDYINNFVIFTTTDCNARCFYCFEKGQKRMPMKKETAEEVADYMIKVSKGHDITIRWFGGEPLFNSTVIDIISQRLREKGIDYRSNMVSNCYLFDEEMVTKAVDLWNLKKVLVTIDGTEDVYNATKAYIYKDENAFVRVLNNLDILLENGIELLINLNMDKRNVFDLMSLADKLGDRYGGYMNCHARAVLLKEYCGKINAFDTEQEAYDRYLQLTRKLKERGLRRDFALSEKIKNHSCMADDPKSVTIMPDGGIGRCEHYGDSHEVGSIYDGIDEEKMTIWKERRPSIQECRECALYPDCFRLKMCNACSDECGPLYRMQRLEELHRRIEKTYIAWKEKT